MSEDDPTIALIGLGWTALVAGEDIRSQELFEEALTRVRDAGERFETALVLSFLGELAWARGEFDEAKSSLEEGRELARVMGAPFPHVRCLTVLTSLATANRDRATAAELADRACELAEQSRLPYALTRALHVRGDLKRARRNPGDARADYESARAISHAKGDRDGEAGSIYRLALLARAKGADDDAMSLLHEALAIQADVADGRLLTLVETLAGMGAAQGRAAHAARLFGGAESLRKARGTLRRPDEVTGYQADVKALRRAMDRAELKGAWSEGAALNRDELVALAMRGRGSRDPDRPVYGWASLTQTERSIVDLVAEGLTNREVGEQLFISDRTVQGHIARIFRKLDMTSRRELRNARRQLKS